MSNRMEDTMTAETTYERTTADDVKVGDRIARTRTEQFTTVETIDEGPVARRFSRIVPEKQGVWVEGKLEFRETGRMVPSTIMRPRRTAKLWREVQS
jgi:hypothetical protein